MHFPTMKSARISSSSLVMAIICLGIFITAVDQTVIYGALPGMMVSINLPVTQLDQASWIVTGYLLGYTFAMPIMGRVSDVYGHSRIYILSLVIFLIGSILVAISGSLQWIVGARIIQAIGGGAVLPIAMAIAGDMFSGKNRAVAIGVIGAAAEAGGAIGPFYGAVLAQFWGWQWIFWINIPISLVIILIVFFFLKPSLRTAGKIDYADGLLLAIGLALFSLGISQQSTRPYFWIYMLGFLICAGVIFFFFVFRIRRVSEPLINISMFKNFTFSAANTTNLFVGGALIVAMANIPLMSDTILGSSPLEGGLRLLRFTIMLSIGAIAGGFISRRFGFRLPTIMGLMLSSAGFFFMSRWDLSIADPQMTLQLAMCGFGFGLVIAPLGTAVLNSVKEERKGIASSVVIMARMIGMIIGLSAITAWGMDQFHLMTADLTLGEIMADPQKITQPILALFHNFFMAAAVICLVGILPAIWVGRKKPPGN